MFGIDDAPIEVERDRPRGNVECEFPIGAFIVFPAGVFFL